MTIPAAMANSAEIIASLTTEDIPIKLRCAACNGLANNAYRMPCCDQSICEDCFTTLPQACPICLHEPVNKDDCRPNKALRTTVKAFLRRKGIEFEAARKKELASRLATDSTTAAGSAKDGPVASSISNAYTNAADQSQVLASDVKQEPRSVTRSVEPTLKLEQIPPATKLTLVAQKDIPRPSVESPISRDHLNHDAAKVTNEARSFADNGNEMESQRANAMAMNQTSQWGHENNGMGSMFGSGGSGFEAMNGGFPNVGNMNNMGNLGFNGVGDYNQMMSLMPNGMQSNMMGSFPNVMGMSGMGIDAMAMSQGMYGGFSGPNMSMNGMNGGMGFDNGQNAFGGFNAQLQNQNSYGGHMGGSFGANAGFGEYNMPQHQGAFNQQQQQQQQQQPPSTLNHDFHHGQHNPPFQYRGRGRGHGGYGNTGRGRGFSQAYQGRQAYNDYSQTQVPQQPVRRGSPVYTPMVGAEIDDSKLKNETNKGKEIQLEGSDNQKAVEEQLQKEFAPGDAGDEIQQNEAHVDAGETTEQAAAPNNEDPPVEKGQQSEAQSIDTAKPLPIPSVVSESTTEQDAVSASKNIAARTMAPPSARAIPTGPASQRNDFPSVASPRGRGFGRGFVRGHSDFRAIPLGRGAQSSTEAVPRSSSIPISDRIETPPSEPKGVGVEGAPKAPKALRQGLPNTGIRPAQDTGISIVGRASASAQARPDVHRKSPSPAPHRSRSRSRSPSRHQLSHHRRHHHRSRSSSKERVRDRHRDRQDRSSRTDDPHYGASDNRELRTRESSADAISKRSSHRNHHDHDKESSRSKHHSHRSHRDRSRSRDKDHHANRKRSRSRSPDIRINGVSRIKGAGAAGATSYPPVSREEAQGAHKRRDKEEDTHHRDRKRSRREEQAFEDGADNTHHRSKNGRRDDKSDRGHHDRSSKAEASGHERPKSPPKGPKIDQHAMEREARNRERQMKEIQRRAFMEGKGVNVKGKSNGRAGERRHSYKYEDEDLISKVEKERESGRWS